MILICLLIYIIGFFVTHWVVGPTHYINGKGIPDDVAQRAIALLWPITAPIFIMAATAGMLINNTFKTKEK
jgi:hypothetical protein